MRGWMMVASAALALLPGTALATTPASGDAWQTAAHLHRGMNVLGYDPLWKDPAKARFKARDFAIIRSGGFDFVRVVLQSFDHMGPDNKLDPRWLAMLDKVIDEATKAGLSVIVDEHDFNKCADDAAACEAKVTAFWQQIGARYRNAPGSVLFELLNEPHGALDADHWNAMLSRLIPVVRATNPTRTLVIGPTQWNSLKQLDTLQLPENDRNILVTFHYYEPFRFTHQGASWAGDVAKLHDIPLTADDERTITADFDTAAAWSKAHDRPILLGEFGAYDKGGVPIAERARYDRDIRTAAESHHMPWAYWQFSGDFIAYDLDHDAWVEPIHHALTGD
ncbi:MAG: glycoside hydrolase family 5 protein [Sphingomonas sp.]